MHATDDKRMPPLGRALVDDKGVELVDAWIRSMPSCP